MSDERDPLWWLGEPLPLKPEVAREDAYDAWSVSGGAVKGWRRGPRSREAFYAGWDAAQAAAAEAEE